MSDSCSFLPVFGSLGVFVFAKIIAEMRLLPSESRERVYESELSLDAGKIMIYLNVVLTVKDSADIAEIQSLLSEQGRLSRAEPGCLRFEVYHSQNDPKVFLLNEHWADQAAVDAHRKATAYTTIYQPKVLPKVERTPHPSDLVS